MSIPGVIEAEGPSICQLCGAEKETRPYGPNGEEICFPCGQKDMRTTERQMHRYLFGEGPSDEA
jgi:hypothetical protein